MSFLILAKCRKCSSLITLTVLKDFLFASSVFTALDSSTVELFLEVDGLETECDGLKLLHECMKNIPVKISCDKHECSRAIIESLAHQVNIQVLFWKPERLPPHFVAGEQLQDISSNCSVISDIIVKKSKNFCKSAALALPLP